MKLHLKKKLNGLLEPAFPSDQEALKKVAVGEIYEYETKKPRNIMHHRKFFALIKMVFENQEGYNNVDALREDLIIAAGYYDSHVNFDGETKLRPRSISFSSMPQDEFEKLYEAVLDVVVKYFHFEKSDVRENIEQFY